MLLITTVNWVGYHRNSKMKPDEWIWRDRLNPAPVLTRMVPPLLATYWLGNNRAINLTNEEASQALASLGQIVINLAVSPAFVRVEPWLENLGSPPLPHAAQGLVPDSTWIDKFALSLAAIDRDAAQSLVNAIRATGMEKHMVFAGSIHRLVLAVATFCGIGDDQVYQWFNIVF